MAGEPETFTKDQVDTLIAERLAAETAGLKKSQQDLLKEKKTIEARLASFEGVDPEEARQLKQAADEAEKKRLQAEGDWKSMEAQLVKKYEGEKEVLGSEAKRLRSAMERHLIDAAAASELAKHSDAPSLLLPHVRGRMKVIEQDGEFHARIVDESGNVRIGKGQGSTPMTLAELVEEMKQDKDFALAFRGSGSSGGGASRSNGGAGGAAPKVIASTNSPDFLASLESVAKGTTVVGS